MKRITNCKCIDRTAIVVETLASGENHIEISYGGLEMDVVITADEVLEIWANTPTEDIPGKQNLVAQFPARGWTGWYYKGFGDDDE